MKGETSERGPPLLRIDPKWYVRYTTSSASLTTERSIQDALRSFFQPIKTDDPRLDFYTMYKREAMEYDADYVKKYDEDLNTTLIFVRPFHSLLQSVSPIVIGGSVLRGQFSVCHRRPFSTSARPERAISSPPPRDPSHSQSVRYPWREPRYSVRSGGSTKRDRHRHYSHVRKPYNLPARSIRRNVGKAMA